MPDPSRTEEELIEDRVSALPDGVLQHVLGFLPADEAVQASVLARRWRHLWRSMGRLRIVFSDRWESAADFNRFVSHLLLHYRGLGLALDEVDLEGYPFLNVDDIHLNIWIQHALSCQASVLSVSTQFGAGRLITLDDLSLVSTHLKRLELDDLLLKCAFLDFASCLSLQDLKITFCGLYIDKISSQSIKHLSIIQCSMERAVRINIAVPSLIWLHLDCYGSKTPLLQRMPSLQTAFVKLENFSLDYCGKGCYGERCGSCALCSGKDDHNGSCILLGGLSSAMNLELTAKFGVPIFSRDLRWCPTFSQLKILLLNEWCVDINLRELACILDHAPVLEKLTLQLDMKIQSAPESEETYITKEELPAISERLIVEIKCREVDMRVWKILRFLTRFCKQINIIPDSRLTTSFSFERL